MAALREVFARFGVQFDSRQLERGATRVNAVTSRLREFGSLLVGSMIVRGLGRFVRGTLDMADNLDKVSQQVGLTTAELQGFSHAAALAGVDAGAFANAMGQLQRRAHDASEGTAESLDAFVNAGIEFQDANGELLSGADLLRNVAEGLHNVENSSTRTALSMELMGRSGRRMLPMFAEGAEGVDRMAAELEALGGGLSQDFIDRSVEINDNLTRLRLSMQSVKSTIMISILPTLNRLIQIFTRLNTLLSDMPGVVRVLTGAFVALGVAAAAAALRSIAAWLAAAAPILLVVVAVGLLALAASELWATWNGGESILRMFIDELFPGMVDGLDSTDRAIIAVTEHISRMIEGLTLLGEMAAPLADVIMMPFRPLLAVLGLAVDLGQGRGIADAGQRALGRFTADTFGVFGGRSLVGYNPEEEEMRGRREGGARALADVRRRAGGGILAREETRTEAMLPTHLRGQRRQQTVTVDVAGNPVEINFHDVGILSPEESARIAKAQVQEALDRHTRSLYSTLVPDLTGTIFER